MGEKKKTCGSHTLDIIQDQRRKIVYLPVQVNHSPRDSNQYQRNDTQGAVYQNQGSPKRRQQIKESSQTTLRFLASIVDTKFIEI
ncbi:hypothetical protein AYI68_g4797 [Smittium mucronatum]|uniref:Uncharacterized protein n=1 Tax=Smittium mucronatum TaxID=133383 RepID=A0A1R0GW19_9FUNG|nr:hypothetical protein AYI68_g4797 [Smittium mucronatum]